MWISWLFTSFILYLYFKSSVWKIYILFTLHDFILLYLFSIVLAIQLLLCPLPYYLPFFSYFIYFKTCILFDYLTFSFNLLIFILFNFVASFDHGHSSVAAEESNTEQLFIHSEKKKLHDRKLQGTLFRRNIDYWIIISSSFGVYIIPIIIWTWCSFSQPFLWDWVPP